MGTHRSKQIAVGITGSLRVVSECTLSTVLAVTGVPPTTFHTWCKRPERPLFPWTRKVKGWKSYSIADVCVTYVVKGLIENGCQAQFSIDFATALLPRFEAMWKQEDWAFQATIALAVQINHGTDTCPDFEIEVEYHSTSSPIGDILSGRFAWGSAVFLDMMEVWKGVLTELRALKPETIEENAQAITAKLGADVRPDDGEHT